MAKPGDVLAAPQAGIRIECRRTTEDTAGELVEYDVVGRPRGIFAQPHVHPHQTERHEVIEGTMRIKKGGQWRVLGPGEVAETPPGTTHRHYASAADPAAIAVARARSKPAPHETAPMHPKEKRLHGRSRPRWASRAQRWPW